MSIHRDRRRQSKNVTRTFGLRHRTVADVGNAGRVEVARETTSASDREIQAAGAAVTVSGMIPMRAKLPSSMEPAKHDIDVPELHALPQVSELEPVTELTNISVAAVPAAESDVFLSGDQEISGVQPAAQTDVTLVVYAWHNVQPGVLSWIFPTVRAALTAAYAMRNAVRWAIIRGSEHTDLDVARLAGDVLIENS